MFTLRKCMDECLYAYRKEFCESRRPRFYLKDLNQDFHWLSRNFPAFFTNEYVTAGLQEDVQSFQLWYKARIRYIKSNIDHVDVNLTPWFIGNQRLVEQTYFVKATFYSTFISSYQEVAALKQKKDSTLELAGT